MSNFTYRSIFISDIHLGTKNCKANYLLDFLRSTSSEYLYLVGDIFDLVSMKKRLYWTESYNEILQEIFRKAQSETKVIYIPGNHDAWFRGFSSTTLHGIRIENDTIHITADNKRFFVSHGDEFDSLIRHNRILFIMGERTYNLLLRLNRLINIFRNKLGKRYWSLSVWLKSQINNANEYVNKYETIAAYKASQDGYDGYICGHIHKPGIRRVNKVLYCNDGDWVEHCTALTEDENGCLRLLYWSDHARIEAVSQGLEVDTTVSPFPIHAYGKH